MVRAYPAAQRAVAACTVPTIGAVAGRRRRRRPLRLRSASNDDQSKAAVGAEPHGPRSARGSESRRQRSARKADVRPLRCSAACLWRDLNDGSPSSWRWCPGRSPGMSMSHPPTCAARGRPQAQQRERQQRSRPLRVLGRPGRHLGHRPSAEAHAQGRWAVATWYCDEAVAGSVASDYWKWLETALLVGVRPAEVG